MNPGLLSVRNDRVVFVAMAFVLLGGVVAYRQIGRLEDPEFTIKSALIVTPYPGASADEVAKEVTNPIESACQQLGQLSRVESQSTRGLSIVTAIIQDKYHRDAIPQVWDELRRKINDAQPQLPLAVRGHSKVVDDFGDVYGIFLAITGDGYTFPELRRYAEFLRRELLLAPNVKKVELFGQQQEVVFLEISRQRLSQLGINEDQIYRLLQAQNVAVDGGRVRVGDEHVALDPKGEFNSADDMLDLVIASDRTGRQIQLRDVATLERADQDPPQRLLCYDGKPAIGLGISTVQGGQCRDDGQCRAATPRTAQSEPAARHRNRRDQLSARSRHLGHERFHVQPRQGGDDCLRRAVDRDGPQDRINHRRGAVPDDHGDVPRHVHEGGSADGADLAGRTDYCAVHAHR
jgi:multidrug efflux pump subunit AcrB